jgi:hypothetical protein
MKHEGKTFTDEKVTVDGNQFVRCTFDGCQIIYCGGELPFIQECHFNDCLWRLMDAAWQVERYLKNLYASGLTTPVDAWCNMIRGIEPPVPPDLFPQSGLFKP